MLLLVTLSPMAEAAAKNVSKQEAQQWVGFTISCKKKLLAAAKKTKSEKNIPAFLKAVNNVYAGVNKYPGVDPMGECRPAAAPSGEECDEAFLKKEKQISKLDAILTSELNRIKSENYRVDGAQEALVKSKLIMDLLEVP